MWFLTVAVVSVVFGILALIGLLALAKELFCDSSLEANFADAGGATVRDDVGSRASGRRCVMTR